MGTRWAEEWCHLLPDLFTKRVCSALFSKLACFGNEKQDSDQRWSTLVQVWEFRGWGGLYTFNVTGNGELPSSMRFLPFQKVNFIYRKHETKRCRLHTLWINYSIGPWKAGVTVYKSVCLIQGFIRLIHYDRGKILNQICTNARLHAEI